MTLLKTESQAQRLADPAKSRYRKIVNPGSRNACGEPVAYKLVPSHAGTPLLAQPDATIINRPGRLAIAPFGRYLQSFIPNEPNACYYDSFAFIYPMRPGHCIPFSGPASLFSIARAADEIPRLWPPPKTAERDAFVKFLGSARAVMLAVAVVNRGRRARAGGSARPGGAPPWR